MSEHLDLDILKILKVKENYDKYASIVNYDVLCTEAKSIYTGYEEYYKLHDEDITYTKFSPWFFNTLHRDFSDDDIKYYKKIFSNINKLDDPSVESTMTRLQQEKLWNELEAIKNTTFNLTDMKNVLVAHESGIVDVSKSVKYLSLDEAFTVDETVAAGYQWRLSDLNNYWGTLKPSQLYVVVATTHTGKSSFVISEACHILRQLQGRSILYFNNERSEKAIFERFMCGVFHRPIDVIRNNLPKVREAYEKKFPGEPLKIFSARNKGKSLREMEAACAMYKPGLVIIDQLDNLVSEKDKSTRRPYEKVYGWARDLAVKYNTPVIGVSQYGVSTDPSGEVIKKQMHQHGTFDAKVDKAANTDFLLGIQDVDSSNTSKRIYLIRAKEGKEGVSFVCKFDRDIGIYDNFGAGR